jgi:cell division cycle 20-like protein 1, cofactor of APC complex
VQAPMRGPHPLQHAAVSAARRGACAGSALGECARRALRSGEPKFRPLYVLYRPAARRPCRQQSGRFTSFAARDRWSRPPKTCTKRTSAARRPDGLGARGAHSQIMWCPSQMPQVKGPTLCSRGSAFRPFRVITAAASAPVTSKPTRPAAAHASGGPGGPVASLVPKEQAALAACRQEEEANAVAAEAKPSPARIGHKGSLPASGGPGRVRSCAPAPRNGAAASSLAGCTGLVGPPRGARSSDPDRHVPSRRRSNWNNLGPRWEREDPRSEEHPRSDEHPLLAPGAAEPANRAAEAERGRAALLMAELLGPAYVSLPRPGAPRLAGGLLEARRTLAFRPSDSSDRPPFSSGTKLSETAASLAARLARRPEAARIPPTPCRALDATGMGDDFYSQLLAWSSRDVLAVGLGDAVHCLRSPFLCAAPGRAPVWSCLPRLCLPVAEDGPFCVDALAFSPDGLRVAITLSTGWVQLWAVDPARPEMSRPEPPRFACLDWHPAKAGLFACGSSSGGVALSDCRVAGAVAKTLAPARGASRVCGLRWSPDGRFLVSGVNENAAWIWDFRKMERPILALAGHRAAVRAIAWSPHREGMLMTGGGTLDRSLRLWHTSDSPMDPPRGVGGDARVPALAPRRRAETSGQVCSLHWSPAVDRVVSAHGFSTNQLACWRVAGLEPLATFSAHGARVLHSALSPTGRFLATAAADERVCIWDVFPPRPFLRRPDSILSSAPVLR